MTRIRKKISKTAGEGGQITLSPDELRTAGIKPGDKVEVEAESDRIIIFKIVQP